MCRFLGPSFGVLFSTLPLYIVASNAYLITPWERTVISVDSSTFPLAATSGIFSQPYASESTTPGTDAPKNVSITHQDPSVSRNASHPNPSAASPPAGPGSKSLLLSVATTTLTHIKPSHPSRASLTAWDKSSLRSKPGTIMASETASSNSFASTTYPSNIISTEASASVRITNRSESSPKNYTRPSILTTTVIILETTTTCLISNSRPSVSPLANSPDSATLLSHLISPTLEFVSTYSVPYSDTLQLITSTPLSVSAGASVSLTSGLAQNEISTSRISPYTGSVLTNTSSNPSYAGRGTDSIMTRSKVPCSRTPIPTAMMAQSTKVSNIARASGGNFPPTPSSRLIPALIISSFRSSVSRLAVSSRSSKIFSISTGPPNPDLRSAPSGIYRVSSLPSHITSSSSTDTELKSLESYAPPSNTGHFVSRTSDPNQSPPRNSTTASTPQQAHFKALLVDSKLVRVSSNSKSKTASLLSKTSSSVTSSRSSSITSSVSTGHSFVPPTTCGTPSKKQPATTSWTAGACTITSFNNPTSTLRCASSTIKPAPVTACACPGSQLYETKAGGAGPCMYYTSIDASASLEAMSSCTDAPVDCHPAPTSPALTSTTSSIPLAGQFSVLPTYPSTCHAATITYSSTQAFSTGQILIDGPTAWGNSTSKWSFSAGAGIEIDIMNNTGLPGNSSSNGNPEAHSKKLTRNHDGSWTMTIVPEMPILSLIATASDKTKEKSFPMTITSVIPCDKPVALVCNNSFSDLTPDQWMAFEVDQFVAKIEHDFLATKGPNFFDWFLETYIGDTIKAPCQIDQDGCDPLSVPCTFVKPGPYQRQAFFVVSAMITLSRYLRYVWLAYERSRGDLQGELATWTTAFVVPQKTQTWQNIVAITASVFGMLAVIGFAAGPFMPEAAAIFTPLFVGAIGSGLFGINSVLNSAINAAGAEGQISAAEIQFDAYAQADHSMIAYINASEKALIDTHNSYFLQGTNLSQALQGGLFVANTPIAELSDGDFSGAVVAAANWFDNTMIWSLINEIWKSDDNYIVFVPYGPVKWYGGDIKQFDAQMCHDQFMANSHWNSTIYGSCDAGPPDHPGFASFMTAQKLSDFNTYNKKSYYEVTYSYQGYNFNPNDVMKSSLSGYFQYGFDYNATSVPVGQLLTAQNQQPLSEYANKTATSPGEFNIPVCIISDTSYVPACTITDWGDRGDPCYTSPQACLNSMWTDPTNPKNVQNFTSHVSAAVVSGLSEASTYDDLFKRQLGDDVAPPEHTYTPW